MSEKGKLNESEFAKGLQSFYKSHKHFWYRRWPDHRDWIKVNPKLQAPRAPADFVAIHEGVFYALECKSTRGKRYLMSWIKPHQEVFLLDIQHAGGASYIVFMKRGFPVQCCGIPIREYLALKKVWREKGFKSIPVTEMLNAGVPIPRVKGSFKVDGLFKQSRNRS